MGLDRVWERKIKIKAKKERVGSGLAIEPPPTGLSQGWPNPAWRLMAGTQARGRRGERERSGWGEDRMGICFSP